MPPPRARRCWAHETVGQEVGAGTLTLYGAAAGDVTATAGVEFDLVLTGVGMVGVIGGASEGDQLRVVLPADGVWSCGDTSAAAHSDAVPRQGQTFAQGG